MFEKPTAFIVGAGASSEYRLPSGAELRNRIASAVRFRLQDGGETLLNAIKHQFNNEKRVVDTYESAGYELAAVLPIHASIDEALHYLSDNPPAVQLGKIAIANAILSAERNSSLSENSETARVNLENTAGAWLGPFLSMALGSRTRQEVEQAFANVTLINFNYDRTVEQYLYSAVKQYGQVSADIAANAVARLTQIRPYGSIGNLPWQDKSGTPYGVDPEGIDLFEIAKGIRTYTEQRDETDTEQRIDQALKTACLVVFLGFGFHAQNMKLLRPLSVKRRGNIQKVFGTVIGIHKENHVTLQEQLHDTLSLAPGSPRATLLPWPSYQLLSDLKPSIMAAAS